MDTNLPLPAIDSRAAEREKNTWKSRRCVCPHFLQRRLGRYIVAIAAIVTLWTFLSRTASYESSNILSSTRRISPQLYKLSNNDSVDWSQFAYFQYATDQEYLCNSLMIFDDLARAGAKADRLLLYPEDWKVDDLPKKDHRRKLLLKARDVYEVQLSPTKVLRSTDHEATWSKSLTKLLAFNQTQYKRVMSLDSDAVVLQAMDELFLLPRATIAMPKAYWLPKKPFSSQVVLVEPSLAEMNRILHAISAYKPKDYDMDVLNRLYGSTAMVLPHEQYNLITGEFRGIDHTAYLGADQNRQWKANQIYDQAKYMHFSDWPVPKPWEYQDEAVLRAHAPECRHIDGIQDCRDREIWMEAYASFAERRLKICGAYFDAHVWLRFDR